MSSKWPLSQNRFNHPITKAINTSSFITHELVSEMLKINPQLRNWILVNKQFMPYQMQRLEFLKSIRFSMKNEISRIKWCGLYSKRIEIEFFNLCSTRSYSSPNIFVFAIICYYFCNILGIFYGQSVKKLVFSIFFRISDNESAFWNVLTSSKAN